jgi:hypothetical protein
MRGRPPVPQLRDERPCLTPATARLQRAHLAIFLVLPSIRETDPNPPGTKPDRQERFSMPAVAWMPLATVPEAFAGGFGAAAAIVLIGGGVLLRWQRNRLQFNLMQSAIERGVTAPLPGAAPLWLLSLRQGVSILMLGVGLLIAGYVTWTAAKGVPMPTGPTTQAVAGMIVQARQFRPPPFPMDDQGPPDDEQGPPGGRPRPGMGMGMGRRPGLMSGGGPEDGGATALLPPPRGGPVVENWHRAQDEKAVATVAMGAGLVCVLLGLVRVIFALAERRYAGDTNLPGA